MNRSVYRSEAIRRLASVENKNQSHACSLKTSTDGTVTLFKKIKSVLKKDNFSLPVFLKPPASDEIGFKKD